jgi:GGDEF domain-containing protein
VADGAGVLYVDTKYSWGFNDKQQKWIREVSGVLGELLERQESMLRQQCHARLLTMWQKLDQATFREEAPEEYCQLMVDECAQFLGAEYGFLALKEARKQHFHMLACTSSTPRNLRSQHHVAKQGLVGRILQNRKSLLIARLNSQTSDHFLFSSSEGLPHYGTFWGTPAVLTQGHTVGLAFLTRKVVEWSAEEQHAVFHVLQVFRMILEQFYSREECSHLKAYDLSSGLHNGVAFEARTEGALAQSMQNSSPSTLALLQFEPWQLIPTKAPPKQIRRWLADLAADLVDAVPANAVLGQLAENRIGIVLPGVTPQEAKPLLSQLVEIGQHFFAARIKGIKIQLYLGSVGFPQDGTRSEELWPMVYRNLYAALRSKVERMTSEK